MVTRVHHELRTGCTTSVTACCWLSARPAASSASRTSRGMVARIGARNRSSRAAFGCAIGMPAFSRMFFCGAGEAGCPQAVAEVRCNAGGQLQGGGQQFDVAGTDDVVEDGRQ